MEADGAGATAETKVTSTATSFTYSEIGNPTIGGKTMSEIITASGTYTISVDKDGKISAKLGS